MADLFDHDPLTGMTEYFHYDEVDGSYVIETRQNVSSLIALNKASYNDSEKSTRYGEWAHIAETPNTVMMQLAEQGIVTPAGRILDHKKYRAWLNDPDNRFFRVRTGRV